MVYYDRYFSYIILRLLRVIITWSEDLNKGFKLCKKKQQFLLDPEVGVKAEGFVAQKRVLLNKKASFKLLLNCEILDGSEMSNNFEVSNGIELFDSFEVSNGFELFEGLSQLPQPTEKDSTRDNRRSDRRIELLTKVW